MDAAVLKLLLPATVPATLSASGRQQPEQQQRRVEEVEVEKCPLIPSDAEGEVVKDDMNNSEGITRQVKLEADRRERRDPSEIFTPNYGEKDLRVSSALFSIGSSGIYIGIRSHLQDRGSASDSEMDRGEDTDIENIVQRFLQSDETLNLGCRGVIVFLSPSASTSAVSSDLPATRKADRTVDSKQLAVVERTVFNIVPPSPLPSIPPYSTSIPLITAPLDTGPAPRSSLRPCPGLIVRAGSNKKESSGQKRSLWCDDILPACLAFYREHCGRDERGQGSTDGSSQGQENDLDKNIEDIGMDAVKGHDSCSGSNVQVSAVQKLPQSSNGSILIICEDGMLSCTAAMTLLLSCYRTSYEFNIPLSLSLPQAISTPLIRPPNSSIMSTSSNILTHCPPPPSSYKRPCLSKEDIRACLSVLQMHVPSSDQMPRRLMKELNMFFSSTALKVTR